jgi:hypothetical protein
MLRWLMTKLFDQRVTGVEAKSSLMSTGDISMIIG